MTFAVLPGGKDPSAPASVRVYAPGAPPSPGTLPFELAMHLHPGEALLWWDEKAEIDARPLWLVSALVIAVLGFITLLGPEFWLSPFGTLWPPLAAVVSPLAVVLAREHYGQRAILVTDGSIVEVRRGRGTRLPISGIRRIRRDLLLGGIRLEGAGPLVRIPPSLVASARAAVSFQRRAILRGPHAIDDQVGFLR